MTEPDTRARLMQAALVHVPFDGMNDKALNAGARDLGLNADLVGVLFPQGGADLAAAYHRNGDAALRAWMGGQPPGRISDRIADAIWQRLVLADPEMVRAGTAIMALPQNAVLGGRLMWETADTIWTGLGDSSEDVNWWTKRATLASVCAAVVLYWLGDSSEGRADTRAFIDRRIADVLAFEKFKASVRKLPGVDSLMSAATGWIRKPGATPATPGRVTPVTTERGA